MNTYILLANGSVWVSHTDKTRWFPKSNVLLYKLINSEGI